MSKQLPKYFWGIAFLLSIISIQAIPRSEFWQFSGIYLIAFIAYIGLMMKYRTETKWLLTVTIIAVGSFFFFSPLLSEDVYRFLWDGKLWLKGINPYEFQPDQITVQDPYLIELYHNMTDLTKGNYTCYPPFNQLYFFIAGFGTSLKGSILTLKALIVLSIIPGMIYLNRLLDENKLKTSYAWFVILNPLFLIETFGNLHFEGVMMSFLVIAFYFLKRNLILASIFFTLAIQLKLLPLILLPFLIRYLGLKITALFGALTLLILLATTIPFMNEEQFIRFLESLRLYFGVFEFNSFIPHYLQEFIALFTGFNPIRYTSLLLSLSTTGILLYLSFYRQKKTITHLISDLAMGLIVYYLLSNTVHPWYIISLLFLYPFSQKRSTLLWTLLIVMSYSFYSQDWIVSRWIINLEYALLLISLYFDYKKVNSLNVNDHAS